MEGWLRGGAVRGVATIARHAMVGAIIASIRQLHEVPFPHQVFADALSAERYVVERLSAKAC